MLLMLRQNMICLIKKIKKIGLAEQVEMLQAQIVKLMVNNIISFQQYYQPPLSNNWKQIQWIYCKMLANQY